MFCPNCGKELPDNAKFCAHCGKPVIGQDQQGVHQSIIQDYAAPEQDSSDAAGGPPQKSVIFTQKKSKNTKVFICLAAALVLVMGLVIGVVFAVRASNEQAMIREIPFAIYNDGGGEKVEAYYKDYFGESLTIGCNVEDFSITRGADPNSYNLTGKFEATDISQDSRPTYDAYVTGTVTTNFFRTKWSINWSLQYQTPEPSNDYPDPDAYAQPSKGLPDSSTNGFPPVFIPTSGYSDHLGEYIDEYGRVLQVSVGTSEGVSYFINIYANQTDAINNASPLLTASHGTLEYRNGYMIIAFEDSSGNGLYFERDNFIEDNYTLYVYGSPYVNGCDMEPFLDTTFYMTEQYIDPMT